MNTIPVDQIAPNPLQPRGVFDQSALNELAQSIRENGLLQPILVERHGAGFILIAGERRLRAVKQLGWKEIPAEVREQQAKNTDKLLMALVENIQRADMRPVDEARAYKHLHGLSLSFATIAHKTGKSLATITARLRLLDLDEEIQELINEGQLPVDKRAADALLSVGNREDRIKLARRLARPGQSIKAVQTACENFNEATITSQRIKTGAVPAVELAAKRAEQPTEKPVHWDMLKQLGRVPEWDLVTAAARNTCDTCALREVASPATCRQCAAVDLVAFLMRQSKSGGRGE